jgi:hypothetical protein
VGLFANSSTFTNIIMLKIGVYRRASAVAIRRGKMDNADSQDNGRATLRSWAVVLGIALAFLLWGLLVYSSVGDKGPPGWDFDVVPDVPGQSPYSTHHTKRLPTLIPSPEATADGVTKQHVMEPQGQAGTLPEKGSQ